MRKLLSVLSVTGLLLALSAVPAKATCQSVSNFQVPGITGYTFTGDFCYSSTYDFFSFTGTVTRSGQSYDVAAVANVTKGSKQVTVSGSVTISQGGTVIKQLSFNKTVSINANYGGLDGLITWGEKLASQLP